MSYIISPHPQGSAEWLQDRAGKATGSRAGDILAKIKSGEAAKRADYRVQLAVERICGTPAPSGYVNDEMRWGTEQEPFARMAYESATGAVVREAGFAYHQTILAGCSVDGFIDEGSRLGLLEIKCPKSSTHVGYLLAGRLPPAYEPQILHNMWITGAQFADFVSFDPRLPEHLQLFRIRIERDDAAVNNYVAECMSFLADVENTIKLLNERVPK